MLARTGEADRSVRVGRVGGAERHGGRRGAGHRGGRDVMVTTERLRRQRRRRHGCGGRLSAHAVIGARGADRVGVGRVGGHGAVGIAVRRTGPDERAVAVHAVARHADRVGAGRPGQVDQCTGRGSGRQVGRHRWGGGGGRRGRQDLDGRHVPAVRRGGRVVRT